MNSVLDQTVVRLKDFRAGDVGRKVSDAVGSVADHLVGAAKNTDGFVRSSPWQAAGAVAIAGLAAGLLMARTTRRARRRAADPTPDGSAEVAGG